MISLRCLNRFNCKNTSTIAAQAMKWRHHKLGFTNRCFSIANNPANGDADAAEAYPMRILYQKEILKEFEKQQKERIMKQFEVERMEEGIKGVFPKVIEDKNIEIKEDEQVELQPSPIESLDATTLFTTKTYEDTEQSDYEIMLAYKRLRFKMSRERVRDSKNKLRMILQPIKKA